MIPLFDTHIHLYGGLDDGPHDEEMAIEMCRMAYEEGTRVCFAVAHQNERWPDVNPDAIRRAHSSLVARLNELAIPLTVYPCGEVMVKTEFEQDVTNGAFLTIADKNKYILIELPTGLYLDLRYLVQNLRGMGLRPILAHPERHPEFLHDAGNIERLIELGCVVQVTADALTNPANREDMLAIRRWVKRGIVHVVCSDGHSPTRRPPGVSAAYKTIASWTNEQTADRILSTNPLAIVSGLSLNLPSPQPPRGNWFSRLFAD